MEGVERTNTAMVRPQQQGAGLPPRNPYAMDVDRVEETVTLVEDLDIW